MAQVKNIINQKFRKKSSGTQYRTLWQLLHLDFALLFCLTLLIGFGFIILYSASNQQTSMLTQEVAHIGLAAAIMFILAQLPPSVYERWTPWLYTLGTVLLVAVLIIGKIDKGAQRWLNLGLFRFQPSELMKIAIPMMLAWYFSHRQLPPKLKDIAIAGLLILIPTLLTLKEPDLGTAIILMASGCCVLILAGIGWRLVASLSTLVLITLPILWHFLHSYQQQRILTFLNPSRDPLGAGYHIIQSKIAIGSGGFFGKGWLAGTQSHLHFLPEHATDFIFAVLGEEFGLLGNVILITLYMLIVARCLYIAYQAQSTYTRLLAGSLSLLFFISVFVNIGMVSGILPVVGLPLPLISYGGSSMLAIMAAFGILMSIQCHRSLLAK